MTEFNRSSVRQCGELLRYAATAATITANVLVT